MEISNAKKILHLYHRAGFGLSYAGFQSIQDNSIEHIVDALFKESESFSDIEAIQKYVPEKKYMEMNEDEKKELRALAKEKGKELNIIWLKKLNADNAQLREKMTLFWHGHFACRIENPYHGQLLNNAMRKNALGKFKDLLMAVSTSPAMPSFLNNQQNNKDHPNENFARELMELFTIGRGNYTENDVKQAARAFTGWGFDKDSEFKFRNRIHDDDDKVFMGQAGNLGGEEVIDIILAQKKTAVFLTRKIYRYFVNDTPDESRINELATLFYDSNYDIESLMRYIFTADWFYNANNIGGRIKSPVELLVNITRTFKVNWEDADVLLYIQRLLNQILFLPPNVSGWAGGKGWIDSSSLMMRLKLPSVILNCGIIEYSPKEDIPDSYLAMIKEEEENKTKIQQKVKATADWDYLLNQIPNDISSKELAEYFLQPTLRSNIANLLNEAKAGLKPVIVQLVSTPEYQLC